MFLLKAGCGSFGADCGDRNRASGVIDLGISISGLHGSLEQSIWGLDKKLAG